MVDVARKKASFLARLISMHDSPHSVTQANVIFSSLLATSQMLSRQLDRDLRALGELSSTDYLVLTHLAATSGASARMTELAADMVWSKSRLSHQVSRMQDRGFVQRTSCAKDGRGFVVGLTEKGSATLHQARPIVRESVDRHVVAQLTDDELATLEIIMKKLVTHLGATEEKGERTDDVGQDKEHA